MKVCCELGKYWDLMTPAERLGCNHDHCRGPTELEDYLLETCGTFNTNDYISTKDLGRLLENPTDWQQWITLQIEQEGLEKYKTWYARMFERNAVCDELIEAHNGLFKGEIE